jgi:hypothetical protein
MAKTRSPADQIDALHFQPRAKKMTAEYPVYVILLCYAQEEMPKVVNATTLFPVPRYANALPVIFFTLMQYLYIQSDSFSIISLLVTYLRSTTPPDIRRRIRSVLSSSRLTSLQLIQIPPADRHVALILVHAPREALDILRTWTRLLLLLLGSTSITSLRIVETVVHRLRIGVLCRLLVLVLCCWCLWLSRGTATEPAADGVADRRPNCYTTV